MGEVHFSVGIHLGTQAGYVLFPRYALHIAWHTVSRTQEDGQSGSEECGTPTQVAHAT
jgi:hypothetical protein